MSRQAFTTCSPLAVNCVLYQESGLINPWGAGVYYDGVTCWDVDVNGEITGTVAFACLNWSYSETGGAVGEMRIYVNSSNVITATSTSNGTYTIYEGDTVYCQIQILSACGSPNEYATVSTDSGEATLDADDCFNATTGTLTTSTYTVVAGDVGTTITLDAFANCGGSC